MQAEAPAIRCAQTKQHERKERRHYFPVRRLRQPANLLLVSLAVADFFVGALVMPLALADLLSPNWPFGARMCQLWTTADVSLCTASIVNLCAISVDRYLIITRPMQYSSRRTSRTISLYLAVTWLIALAVSISSLIVPYLLVGSPHWEMHGADAHCQVFQHVGYQIWATVAAFYGPTVIMVILYVQIWKAARRLTAHDRMASGSLTQHHHHQHYQHDNNNSRSGSIHSYHHHHYQQPQQQHNHLSVSTANNNTGSLLVTTKSVTTTSNGKDITRPMLHRSSAFLHSLKAPVERLHDRMSAEGKATTTLGVIMSVFICCWLPFFSLALLKPLGLPVAGWLDCVALWLGYANSAANPVIYTIFNREFRAGIKSLLTCRLLPSFQ